MNNKVPQRINDIVGDNVKKLAQLFPSAVKDGEVDFEALKEELGQYEEVGSEKYELTWAGKKNAKKIAQEDVIGRTLKFIPEDSKNADTTENLYIEGDNLEVLKLLRQNYYGAIKMIYIDPPYNTGNDFVYNDSYEMTVDEYKIESGIKDEDGELLYRNLETDGRFHSKWCSMIYARLKVAKDLMSEDGFIFVSMNDKEIDSLKEICNELFGVHNFLACLIWDKNHSAQAGVFKVYHEYILVYCKNIENIRPPRALNNDLFEAGAMKKVSGRHPASEFTFPAGTRFDAADDTEFKGEYGDTEKVIVTKGRMLCKNGKLVEDVTLKAGFTQAEQMRQFFYGNKDSLVDTKGQKIVEFYLNATGKIKVIKERSVEAAQTTCRYGTQGAASTELSNLFGLDECPFSSPKPVEMIKDFIVRFVEDDDYVLDFFSGSATTAHATFLANSEKRVKNVKYIMVQMQENLDESLKTAQKDAVRTLEVGIELLNSIKKPHTICEIGKERIRRAGDKIKSEHPEANIDIGFKVFRTADTNIKWNSLMDMGQVDMNQLEYTPDLVDFMPDANDIDVVYELMLRQRDVALSETLEQLTDIGSRTYLYASSYLVCLETKITEELVAKLAELDPLPIKFIFRDSAFKDDIALKDETFRRLKALIEKNAGTNKPTYTVEFI